MSDSLNNGSFLLDGEEPLGASYDDEADVLYLWRGDAPAEGIGLTTDDGHVVRFDPDTGEVVGFTIVDWAVRWRSHQNIEIRLPALGPSEAEEEAGRTHSVHALVS